MSCHSTDPLAPDAAKNNPPVWLFSAPVDIAAFLGSGLLALALLAYGAHAGLLESDTPSWAWVPIIILIDVAHVYATGFRVYFDTNELNRRPLLYYGTPLVAFVIGWAIHSESPDWFWRILAYVAVFHFVRQQYGWVAMYRGKAREPDGWQKWIDTATIYLATIYPLVYWHARLPREFWWFREWDFQSVPIQLSSIIAPLYWAAVGAYLVKAVWQWRSGRANPGKDIVVVVTILCWYLGIITFNSDYAFTVTNVIIHGVPYIVLTYWYVRARQRGKQKEWNELGESELGEDSEPVYPREPRKWSGLATIAMILATVWLLAYVEQLLWYRFLWQERPWLFGSSVDLDVRFQHCLAALLATPQATHYILDGFIWKRRSNPQLKSL